MNITDVDDKIIRDANKESLSIDKFTRPYRDAFFADLDALRIERTLSCSHRAYSGNGETCQNTC